MISLSLGSVKTYVTGKPLELDIVSQLLTFPADRTFGQANTEIELVDHETGCFGTGLVPYLIRELEERVGPGKIQVTREDLDPEGSYVGADHLPRIPIGSINIDSGILDGLTLRPDQVSSARKMIHRVRGYGKAPTGSGKGEIAFAVIRWLIDRGYVKRSLIYVGASHLLDQTVERARLRGIPAGVLWVDDPGDCLLMVSTVQAAWSKIKRGDTLLADLSFDLVMGDEIHHAPAESWAAGFEVVEALFRYGLSATPHTSHGEPASARDFMMIGLTGEMVFETTERYLSGIKAVAAPTVCFLSCGDTRFWAQSWSEANRRGVTRNLGLTGKLSRIASALYSLDRGYRILILVWEKSHGESFMREIRSACGYEAPMFVGGKKVHLFDGNEIVHESGTLERLRDVFVAPSCIVIGTSTVGEGVDIPDANVLINAYSSKTYRLAIQGPGRILRKKDDALVIDVNHQCHSYLIRQSRARKSVYCSVGYKVFGHLGPVESILGHRVDSAPALTG